MIILQPDLQAKIPRSRISNINQMYFQDFIFKKSAALDVTVDCKS
jgi:hypothetical protein